MPKKHEQLREAAKLLRKAAAELSKTGGTKLDPQKVLDFLLFFGGKAGGTK